MALNLSLVGGVAAQFFDNNGVILSGGKIYTYLAGTTTPAATFTTNVGNVAHTNPIILNSAGRVASSGEIWSTVGVAYKFILKDSNDVLIATYDNLYGIATLPISSDDVTYQPAGANAVLTTVQDKLRQTVSVKDFGAVGDGVTDDSGAFNLAITYVANAGGGVVYAPSDTYKISNTVIFCDNIEIDLQNSLIIGPGVGSATDLFQSGYLLGGVVLSNIGLPLNTRAVFKGQIKNARIQDCGKAIHAYNCIDNCEFSNIKFRDCTYALYADNCFYARCINLFSRGSAGGATNACFLFVNNPNVMQLESIFVTDRALGFEIEGSPHGLKMLNCSAEQCETGVLVSGQSSGELIGPIMFDTCYFEGINNYGINFDGQGAKWNITIENCWFLFVGIAFKTSSDNALDQVEIRRSNKFLQVVTICDFTDNPYHGDNTLQLQQGDCTYTGTPASPVGVLPSLPSGIFLNKRTNVEATQVQYEYGSGDPFIKTKLHGAALIPFEYEGGAGTVYSNIVPFCTHESVGANPANFSVLVKTAINADPYANMVVFDFQVTDAAGPRKVSGFAFGNTIYRLDALAYTVTWGSTGGKMTLTIGGLNNTTVAYFLLGIVRHV